MRTEFLRLMILILACTLGSACSAESPTETSAENSTGGIEPGFISLFNGRDLSGWTVVGSNADSFQIVDGAITRVDEGSSWVYSDGRYADFILKLEFKVVDSGNSGIFFRVDDPENEVYSGIEMQVFGDYGKPVTKHSSGAIYDLVPPSASLIHPPDRWNKVILECDDNWIRIDMNGTRIIEMDLDQWTEPAGKFPTPYAEMPRVGHIGFQNHGDWTAYRNIRIKTM